MSRSQKQFGLAQIGQIALTVDDLERATQFYQDALGIQPLFQVPGMAFFQCGSVRLMLGTTGQGEDAHPSSILYFKVDDIQNAHSTLVERGVEFERDPEMVHRAEDHELWLAFFRDLDGRMLALMSERPVDSVGGRQ